MNQQPQEKITVISHSADFDGIFCREIARKFLPTAEQIGWDYGDPHLEFPRDGKVYVLDLSPECFWESPLRPEFVSRLIWIDHHKSAIEKFDATIPGYRIDGVAACRLAWQWFNQPQYEREGYSVRMLSKEAYVNRVVSEPLAVRLAGEYDIWDRRDPDAELFQHGLRSEELHSSTWDNMLDEDAGDAVIRLLNQGRALQYAKTKENESIIKNAGFTIQFEGLTFLACNHARFNSFLFTAGIKPEHDALLGFSFDGKKWKVSLYHAPGKEHHDLSLIAVKHGGGGHRGACGFTITGMPDFLNNIIL